MKSRRISTAVVMTAAMAALLACSSSKSGGTSTPPASPMSSASSPTTGASTSAPVATDVVITIQDFSFAVPDSVAPGAKITVQNEDDTAHTVTADTGNAFDVKAPGSGTVTFTAPAAPDTYKFHCAYHSNMHGTLVVK